MPLVRIDVVRGRTPEQLVALADSIHAAVVSALRVPQRDRYQVLSEHAPYELRVEDTGLGIPRSLQTVVVQVTSRRRTREDKLALFDAMATGLSRDVGLSPDDLVVTITENDDDCWSFGRGRAQFVTGELV